MKRTPPARPAARGAGVAAKKAATRGRRAAAKNVVPGEDIAEAGALRSAEPKPPTPESRAARARSVEQRPAERRPAGPPSAGPRSAALPLAASHPAASHPAAPHPAAPHPAYPSPAELRPARPHSARPHSAQPRSTEPPIAEPPCTEPSSAEPRYAQVARELKRGIAEGRTPVGAHLPTEAELCESFGISRFTARAAVGVLESAGLVTRRRRVGTVVIATPDETRYSQDVSSVTALLQYAKDTELRLLYVGKLALDAERAREYGATPGAEWIFALGIRHEPDVRGGPLGRPICVTRLFLNPLLQGIEARLRERKTAVYALIERDYGVSIDRVEQDLQGVVLDADDAANLGVQAGAPALRIVRRYYSDEGRLLEVADNVHPSDRFTYRMHLRK